MNNGRREKSQPIAEIGGDATQNRQTQLEELYKRNFNFILDAALTGGKLLPNDAEHIVNGIAQYLPQAPLTDEAFQQWAVEVITPAVDRLSTFYDLRQRYGKIVLSGLWRGIRHTTEPNRFDANSEVVRNLEVEVWFYVFEHLEDFLKPGKAETSTRLFGLARLHAANWFKAQRLRYAAVSRRLQQGRGFLEVEYLSDVELSAMKAAEREQSDAA